jgi:hypothetical protein
MHVLLAEKLGLDFVICGSVDEGSEAVDIVSDFVTIMGRCKATTATKESTNRTPTVQPDAANGVYRAGDYPIIIIEPPGATSAKGRSRAVGIYADNFGAGHSPTRNGHSEGPQVSKAHQRPYSSEPMTMRTAANTTRASHWIAFPEPLSSP